jgi:hypothetical protein
MIRRSATIVGHAVTSLLMLTAVAGCGGAGSPSDDTDLPQQIRFNRHIRPILSDNCFPCHGPDANKRQADLRLDQVDSARSLRDGVRAVVPGDPKQSELIRRIRSDNPDERMPPPASHRTLDARQIALLTRWIEQGAEYEGHWAYLPLRRPDLPELRNEARSGNPIDQFVLARLEDHGLAPSPEAQPVDLLRRLSFDLVGLPPDPQQVDEYIRDASPQAYGKAVERLLASPHYGERMAMYWLDLVRFADTNGYNEDQHRNIYPYRDYVIQAFNDSLPFDQFTVEQLAGDLLPSATVTQKVASGYNRLNKVSTENGSQEKEFRAKYAADRVRTTAVAWMGATLACAECHDHKFDPYTTEDFYRFAAFFADLEEDAVPEIGRIAMPPEIVALTSDENDDRASRLALLSGELSGLRAERAAAVEANRARLDALRARWESGDSPVAAASVEARPAFELAKWAPFGKGTFTDSAGELRLQGPAVGLSGVRRKVSTDNADIEFELEVTELRLPEFESAVAMFNWALEPSGRTKGLTFKIRRLFQRAISLSVNVRSDTRSVELGSPDDLQSLALKAVWDASRQEWEASYGLNGDPPELPFPAGALYDPSPHRASNSWTESLLVGAVDLDLQQSSGPARRAGHPDRFEIRTGHHTIRPHRALAEPPPRIAAIRRIPAGDRSDKQQRTLERYFLSLTPELAAWNDRIDDLDVQLRGLEASLPRSLVSVSRKPHVTRILPRGDWNDDSGAIVSPAVPAFLPQLPDDADRLALGRWLVSPENPLTARVLANRLWKLYFGRGMVRTIDDFGAQGAAPSHPALLDWLAAELVESGWDVKRLIRLIVTSRTYRQSSTERRDLLALDPENQLYARQSSFRLDAEMIRDNALAISGLLSSQVGGPSVKPYQPENYWIGVSKALPGSPAARWVPSSGRDQYRRGLYTYWKRTFLHPSLLAFDAPAREECVAERARSNTPMQALVLLNDPTYVEAARALAERSLHEAGPEPVNQIRWAHLRSLSRQPADEVLEVLTRLYDKHLREYRADPQAALQLLQVGFSPLPESAQRSQLAALTSVCRVLLNLHQTITRS